MKVAYISSSYIPSRTANSIHVMKMCQAMTRLGHDATLFAVQKEPESDQIWHQYGISTPFELQQIAVAPRWRGHDYYLRALWAARSADLIFARHLAAAAWASQLGWPTIYEAHDLPTKSKVIAYLRRFMSGRGMRALIVISEQLREAMLARYKWISPAHIHVQPDGVDLERFAHIPPSSTARQELDLPMQFTVGYAGHLYAGRGIRLLVNVARQLPRIHFLLIGGRQSDITARQQYANDLDVKNVTFTGFIPNATLPAYLAACDVLLMPYQQRVAVSNTTAKNNISTAEWMSPLKMFEYMAMKRPIISSDLPVLREVLNERNAILCPPADAQAWQTAITDLAANQTLRQQLAQQAHNDVQQYSWRKRAQHILDAANI